MARYISRQILESVFYHPFLEGTLQFHCCRGCVWVQTEGWPASVCSHACFLPEAVGCQVQLQAKVLTGSAATLNAEAMQSVQLSKVGNSWDIKSYGRSAGTPVQNASSQLQCGRGWVLPFFILTLFSFAP